MKKFKIKKEKIIDTPHKNKYQSQNALRTLNSRAERKVILKTIRKPEVVIGSYAFNKQVKYPFPYQKRPYTDIDVKSKQHKQTALEIEQALDKSVGMNNYYVSKLEHDEGTTYRVHSRSRNEVVADVSKLKDRIPSKTINRTPYETMKHRKQEIKKLLNKKSAEYRREKDITMMGYITRYEKLLKRERR